MTVIDIRNIFGTRNVKPIEITEKLIYYIEKQKNNDSCEIYIYEYNRITSVENMLTNFRFNSEEIQEHIKAFNENFVLVICENKTNVWTFSIDKKTGLESLSMMIKCDDEFLGCNILNKNNILIYTKRPDEKNKKFIDVDRLATVEKNVSLYDISEGKRYIVRDSRLLRVEPDKILIYEQENEKKQVLICDPYGSEALKERCYKRSRWLKTEVCDYIWHYSLDELIKDIKAQNYDIKLQNIVCAKTQSMARYICMDNSRVYFLAKHFASKKECFCFWDKESNRIDCLFDMENNQDKSYYCINESGNQAFKLQSDNRKIHIKGIVQSNIDSFFDEKFGKFKACINDRFIITQKDILDEQNKDNSTYTYVLDTQKNSSEEFKCDCVIKDKALILY